MWMIWICFLQNNMALRYKCGAEFLPSPLASKAEYALTAQHPLICKGHMTAVAVAVEKGHAVAFLGTATGEVTTPPTPSWLFVFLFSFSASLDLFLCSPFLSPSERWTRIPRSNYSRFKRTQFPERRCSDVKKKVPKSQERMTLVKREMYNICNKWKVRLQVPQNCTWVNVHQSKCLILLKYFYIFRFVKTFDRFLAVFWKCPWTHQSKKYVCKLYLSHEHIKLCCRLIINFMEVMIHR